MNLLIPLRFKSCESRNKFLPPYMTLPVRNETVFIPAGLNIPQGRYPVLPSGGIVLPNGQVVACRKRFTAKELRESRAIPPAEFRRAVRRLRAYVRKKSEYTAKSHKKNTLHIHDFFRSYPFLMIGGEDSEIEQYRIVDTLYVILYTLGYVDHLLRASIGQDEGRLVVKWFQWSVAFRRWFDAPEPLARSIVALRFTPSVHIILRRLLEYDVEKVLIAFLLRAGVNVNSILKRIAERDMFIMDVLKERIQEMMR